MIRLLSLAALLLGVACIPASAQQARLVASGFTWAENIGFDGRVG